MPSRYRRDAARLKAEIVARVSAGETLKAVCAADGMPSTKAVGAWAKADAAFGGALAVAFDQGWRRRAFDPAKAAAFLARARAGEAASALFGQPGMPVRSEYDRWRRQNPAFAAEAAWLLARRDAQLAARGRARRRDFDQTLADRIIVRLHHGVRDGLSLKALLAADPQLPSWSTLWRWRREEPSFDKVVRMLVAARWQTTPPDEAMVEEVVGHIVEGGSFASFSRRPGAPGEKTLRRWMRYPQFAEAVAQACEWREDWFHDQMALIMESAPPGSARELKRRLSPLTRQLARLRHRPKKPLLPRSEVLRRAKAEPQPPG